MRPARKREAAHWLCGHFAIAARRSCRLLGIQRSSFYYQSHAKDQTALRIRLRDLAAARPRFGYRRLHILLRREGWPVNHTRILRLYRLEELQWRMRQRRKRGSYLRVPLPTATQANQRWSMDFVADGLQDGRRFRILTVVDQFTREAVLVEADLFLSGRKVAMALNHVAQTRPLPQTITVDNGAEFAGKDLDAWAYWRKVT